MPISNKHKSMAKSMVANAKYCKKNPKRKCHPFTDGTKVCGCQGGWSVFFATLKTKKVEEARARLIEWFTEATFKSSDVGIPKWIPMAQKVLKSSRFNEKTKAYWRKRLTAWCKKNPKNKVCKNIKINEALMAMNVPLTVEIIMKITEEIIGED